MAFTDFNRHQWPLRIAAFGPASGLRTVLVVTLILAATPVLVLAQTPVAVAVSVCGFFAAAVYVGVSFRPLGARIGSLAIAIGLAVGLMLGDVADAALLWPLFALSCAVVAELLSRLVSGLRAAAVTDPLTGLHNRYGLIGAAEQAIAMSRRMRQPLTVAHIDLDRLKQVNDRDGHLEGDRVLRRCADLWRAEVRTGDILARIGGDEFVLVMPGCDSVDAIRMLDRLQDESPIEWSYGVAELGPGEDLQDGVTRADEQLYAAKAEGRRRRRAARRGRASLAVAMPCPELLETG